MDHTYKNPNPNRKNQSKLPNGSHFQKYIKLGKMSFTGKNESHLQKLVTRHKMGHIEKNGSHLQKLVTLEENGSHLEKCVTLTKCVTFPKMGHTCKNRPDFVTLGKKSHTSRDRAILLKWVTLEKCITLSNMRNN